LSRSHTVQPDRTDGALVTSAQEGGAGVCVPAFVDEGEEWLRLTLASERARRDYYVVYRAALRGDLVTRRICGRLYITASSLAKIAKPEPAK
jgi:hypothetical protein